MLTSFNKAQLTKYGLLALLLLAMPLVMPVFWVRIVTGVFMWVGLALSWNMIGGYMGYVSFGHGAFFGLGAYITGLLMSVQGLPFLPSMIVAGILTCAFAGVVGAITLRLNGAYFAIGTWAFAEMMRQLVLVLPFTGGSYGLRLPPEVNETLFYFIMLALALIVLACGYIMFEKSSFGLKVRAIREEETAAQTLGVNTVLVKIYVFAVSALFPGLIGGAYAYWMTFIHPDSVLGPLVADQMVVMVLLGGIGTVFGPIVGAAVMYIGNRIIWVTWGDSSSYLIILGLAICLIIRFLPEGLINLRFISRFRALKTAVGGLTAREEVPK
ncbi:MAG: branched-chain amino acid ABC transporter permease [Negativicutes bacterium]|nr:branched-chain amino acid ABC transporter permease [Negativicutes bacterium]